MVRKKLSKGLRRNAVKKYTSEKKLHKKSLSWNVFFFEWHCYQWEHRRAKKEKKNTFRTSFPLLAENHFQDESFFEKFGIKYQRGTQEWQK